MMSNNTKLKDYLDLKKEQKKIKEERKKLKDFLDVNVFDYADNKQDIEDIFEIKEPSSKFIESTKHADLLPNNLPILEINHLTKYYGSKTMPTLVNLSLKIYFGDFHVIVGNYSSGKTTLFDCLKGNQEYEGDILIDGTIVKNEIDLINKFSGFVSCEHGWDKFATVEEIIFNSFNEFELNEAIAKKYIRSSLEQFELNHIRNTDVIDLSLLEIKKVQLIIALINDPHIVYLDQPLTGLQFFEKIEFLTLLAKLRNKQRAIVVFSHAINEFSKYASSITLLAKGKVYYTGPIQNLLLSNQSKFAISTSENNEVIEILKEMGCKYSFNELKNILYVHFTGKLNVLLFQKECAKRNIIIEEQKPIDIDIEDLYPTLLKIGSKEAITDINKMLYFSIN